MSKPEKPNNKYVEISYINVSESFEDFTKVPSPREHKIDIIGWEALFHQLPQDQLEVFVCLYLGLKPKEIVKALHFENIARFYNVNAKLKKIYREQNWRVFEYN